MRFAVRALLNDPMGAFGLTLVLAFAAMAVFAPWLAPYDPLHISVPDKFHTPSLTHWAGTDQLGRDLLSRIIWGARTALGIAVTSVGIAGAIGIDVDGIADEIIRALDDVDYGARVIRVTDGTIAVVAP